MANLTYVQPNALRAKARHFRAKVVLFTLPVILVIAMAGHPAVLLALLLFPLLLLTDKQLEAGATGEMRVINEVLQHLPDNFVVFNNLLVPFGQGTRELDYVVVAPTGLFVIEVKYHRGHIHGGENDLMWWQTKHSHAGHPYMNTMRNPLRQTRMQIHALKNYLVDNGAPAWVDAIVVFAHDHCVLDTGETDIPVMTLSRLRTHLLTPRFILRQSQQESVTRVLKALVASQQKTSDNVLHYLVRRLRHGNHPS